MFRSRLKLDVVLLALALPGAAFTLSAEAAGQNVRQTMNGVTVQYATVTLHVEVCSGKVIHVVASPAAPDPSPLVPVVVGPCGGTKFTVSTTASTVALQTSDLRIEIDRETATVRFLSADRQVVLSEQPQMGRDIAPVNIDGTHSYQIQQTFLLSQGESLYGLGQHQEGFLDLRGIPVRLLQANTNIVIPFLLSSKGYGLLWNNPSRTDFDPATEAIPLNERGDGTFRTGREGEYGFLVTGNDRAKLKLAVDGQKVIDIDNMWVPGSAGAKIHLKANTTYKVAAESGGKTRLFVRAPSDTMSFRSEAGQGVDYYFIYGPNLSHVVSAYRQLTGAAPLLPRWAYGFWQCRERYSSQQQILDTAAEFRNRKIPVDALVQDWQYWGKYGWNAMRFDESSYPNPKEMMSVLHRQDLHMVISVWAKFGAETAVDQQFKAEHLLLSDPANTGEPGETQGAENWADLFNPKAQKLFWSDIDRDLFSLGLDGWWLDASEPEGDPLKNDDTFLGPGKLVRNAYPLYEASAVYEGQRATDPNKRVVILSRSAFAGQQRNGSISWSGDISANWPTLRRQIPAGLNFAMSGLPYWTTDIGGFFRPADQYSSPDYHELLIRWFEFGTLCPIFRIHGFRSKTEMWNYGPEVEKILAQYDELRYRLLPYIYSAAWGVTSRGEIIMKALPFVYPHDPSLREVGDQFFFGDSLLVSPVVTPHATSRKVILPESDNWVDFWTGRTFTRGQTIRAEAPIDRIPIFVKAGSIVPVGPVVQSTAEAEDPIEIRIYRGRDADFLLYEDAGDGYDYEHGARAIIPLHWDDHRDTLTIGSRSGTFPGMLKRHNFRVVLVGEGHGAGIEWVSSPDRSMIYDGNRMSIRLSERKSAGAGHAKPSNHARTALLSASRLAAPI
jgi:alpha-D-xyloside xylohydrolase